jgi:TrmH family RNA methyltransferase
MTNEISFIEPKIVLVETSHPGNIGAAARAMKTMSLHELVLVNPKEFPHSEATARAAAAYDVLDSTVVYATLPEAVADCHLVVGVTARPRRISAPVYPPRDIVHKSLNEFSQRKVALVFGRERNGLTNSELDLCQAICTIPSNPDCSSLNIGAAVQILCYEWQMARLAAKDNLPGQHANKAAVAVSSHELEGLYEHLWSSLKQAEFFSTRNPAPLMRKLRRLIVRAQLSRTEINILRGILKAFSKQ